MRRILLAAAMLLAAVSSVVAQSGCAYIVNGAVLTAAQWQFCFQQKQNALGFSPLNSAGGSMSGKLITTASTGSSAGLALLPGTSPSSPVNGDMWTTTAGLFVRINGNTVGPITGGGVIPYLAVSYATAAVLPSSPTYNNGTAGVGATLTAGSNGALAVDSGVPTAGMRVLVQNQVSTLTNGVYTVTQVGDGSTPYILTRATDFDEPAEMVTNAYFFVTLGTANSNKGFVLSASVTTVGTSPVIFFPFAGASAVWTTSGSNIFYTGGNVGVGTGTPSFGFDLQGTLRAGNGTTAIFSRMDNSNAGMTIEAGNQANSARRNLYLQPTGGNVSIGNTTAAALLDIQAAGSTALTGTAFSSTLRTNSGLLGGTATNTLNLSSQGFRASTNLLGLGTWAYRTATGSDWTTTSIGLSMDVDNTPQAGAAIWLGANAKNVGINVPNPTSGLHTTGTVRFASYGAGCLWTDASGNLSAVACDSQASFTCDGATDNTPAWNTAVARIVAAGLGTIRFPSGKCNFASSAVTGALTGVLGFTVEGAGQGSTLINFTGNNDGFAFTNGVAFSPLTEMTTAMNLRNMTIITTGSTSGTRACATFNGTATVATMIIGQSTIDNVFCDNAAFTGGSAWLNGIDITDVGNFEIKTFNFMGPVLADPIGNGIRIRGTTGIPITTYHIMGGQVLFAGAGILTSYSGAGDVEGLTAIAFESTAVGSGFSISGSTSFGQCSSVNGQFGIRSTSTQPAVINASCQYSSFSGNLLLHSNNSVGIALGGSTTGLVAVVNNVIEGFNQTETGIRITGAAHDVVIANNIIPRHSVGIEAQGATTGLLVYSNKYPDTLTQNINSAGSANRFGCTGTPTGYSNGIAWC